MKDGRRIYPKFDVNWTETSPFYRRIHLSLSPANFTTSLAGSVSAFISRPSRVSFSCISISRTDSKKKGLNLFISITLGQSESFRRPKTVKRLLYSRSTTLVFQLRGFVCLIVVPLEWGNAFSWCSCRGFRGRGNSQWLLSVELRRAPYWK